MARTRTTIRRIDPWSILKFGFVANLVLLGIELLAGAVLWYVIQRLELIQTVCELAATVGFEECGVDGGALFDTLLVLGLLGVVIQTGILVFLTFLANLIFDLTGGIGVTLEDDRAPAAAGRFQSRSGVGSRSVGAASLSGASASSGAAAGNSRGIADRTASTYRRGVGVSTSSRPDGGSARPDGGSASSDGAGSPVRGTAAGTSGRSGTGTSTSTSTSTRTSSESEPLFKDS